MSSVLNLIKSNFRFFACKGPDGFYTVDVPKAPTRYFILSSDGIIYSEDTIKLPYRHTGYTINIFDLEPNKPNEYHPIYYENPNNIRNWKSFDHTKITIACYDNLYELEYENTPKLDWIQRKINEYTPIKNELDRIQREKKRQLEIREKNRIAAAKAYNDSLRVEEARKHREKRNRNIRTVLIIVGVFIFLKLIISILK